MYDTHQQLDPDAFIVVVEEVKICLAKCVKLFDGGYNNRNDLT
jgi:hypothetical protein